MQTTPATGSKFLKAEAAAEEFDDGHGVSDAHLVGCGPNACRWFRVLERNIWAMPGGLPHIDRVLSGATSVGDTDRAHVGWAEQPHDVTVDCSLTRPAVVEGARRDDLQFNAAATSVPSGQRGVFALYAAECHPEAADLNPDDLARRYGYKAGASPALGDSSEAGAQASQQAQLQRQQAEVTRAKAEAGQKADAQRAEQQAIDACGEAYDRVYAPYIAHPTKEGGDAVTQASTTRNTCEAGARQRWSGSGG